MILGVVEGKFGMGDPHSHTATAAVDGVSVSEAVVDDKVVELALLSLEVNKRFLIRAFFASCFLIFEQICD